MAATQKPHQASPKGKGFKRNESQESAHAARQRKRDAKRKGLKAGSRQAAAAEKGAANSAGQKKDPRIGSRKPVPLVVAESQKKAVSKPAKPNKSPEQIAEQLAKQQQLKLEQELAAIENDERLNLLLDRLDDELVGRDKAVDSGVRAKGTVARGREHILPGLRGPDRPRR